ncbi:MAG: MmgE/PrpD family protein [Pseudomonadota bacterium]
MAPIEAGTGEIEGRLAAHISAAGSVPLSEEVSTKTKAHVLDSVAAMISGAALPAGRQAHRYIAQFGADGRATIAMTTRRVRAIDAAFANAMAAHADETDDSHLEGRFHPGCGIVSTALALAESRNLGGDSLLRSVALGYDIGARFTLALGMTSPRSWTHSTHCLGANFGATATAGALCQLSPDQCRWLLAYGVQQASGLPIWHRDVDHVQKAFDFGAMAARNAVFAAEFVASGATGVTDSITGEHGYLKGFAQAPNPAALVDGLGETQGILSASIKKWCVGSPIQAALDALEVLISEHGVRADNVARLDVTLPDDRIKIVDNRDMPDICVQHCLAVLLLDGSLPFESAHDKSRMSAPDVLALRKKIRAIPSRELTVARPARQAIVEIETTHGERVLHHTRAVSGTPDKPMTWDDVAAKATDLVAPVLGQKRAQELIDTIGSLDASIRVERIGALMQSN